MALRLLRVSIHLLTKEVNMELSTTSYADRIWNVDIYMPNQSCYLPDNVGKDSCCKVYAIFPLSAITYLLNYALYFSLITSSLKLPFCAEAS